MDNVYGPTGALAAAGIGLLRTMNMDKSCTAELIPADYTVNALIVTAWAVATKRFRSILSLAFASLLYETRLGFMNLVIFICSNETTDPPIYNYHSSWEDGISWGRYMDLAVKHGSQVPSVRSVWCYTFTAAKSAYAYFILVTLLHLLPATLVDAAFILTGRKPR